MKNTITNLKFRALLTLAAIFIAMSANAEENLSDVTSGKQIDESKFYYLRTNRQNGMSMGTNRYAFLYDDATITTYGNGDQTGTGSGTNATKTVYQNNTLAFGSHVNAGYAGRQGAGGTYNYPNPSTNADVTDGSLDKFKWQFVLMSGNTNQNTATYALRNAYTGRYLYFKTGETSKTIDSKTVYNVYMVNEAPTAAETSNYTFAINDGNSIKFTVSSTSYYMNSYPLRDKTPYSQFYAMTSKEENDHVLIKRQTTTEPLSTINLSGIVCDEISIPSLTAQTVCAGTELSTLVASAASEGETYYWQTATNGKIVADNPITAESGQTYYLRAKRTDADCWSDASTAVTVYSFSIQTQPQSANIDLNAATVNDLSVTAQGSTDYSYQWYKNSENSTNNSTIVGTNSTTFTPDISTATENAVYYYVVVTDGCGNSLQSDIVELTVIDPTRIEPQGSCEEIPDFTLTKVSTAPVINGINDEYSDTHEFTVSTQVVGNAQTGYSGKWHAVYDDANIYIFVDIVKPTANKGFIHKNGDENWNGDCIEIRFNVNNSHQTYRIFHDEEFIAADGASTNNVSVATSVNTEAGTWTMEVKLPWTSIGYTQAPDYASNISMDLGISCSNGTDARMTQHATFSTSDQWYQQNAKYGSIKLYDYYDISLDGISLQGASVKSVTLQNNSEIDINPSQTPINIKFLLDGKWRATTISSGDILTAETEITYNITGFTPWVVQSADYTISATAYCSLLETDCSNNTTEKSVSITVPIEQINSTNITVYPNPASDILYIGGVSEATNVILMNLTGQTLISHTGLSLDISALPQGVYLLKVGDYIAKVVKK